MALVVKSKVKLNFLIILSLNIVVASMIATKDLYSH